MLQRELREAGHVEVRDKDKRAEEMLLESSVRHNYGKGICVRETGVTG